MAVLTTDCALPRRRAAAEKDPVSAAASNALNCSSEGVIRLLLPCYCTQIHLF
ncbi:hypothetical protein D3C80_1698760 [compost metagenome]